MPQILRKSYAEGRSLIKTGDALLFRAHPGDIESEVIAAEGRSPYCHVGMAWWGTDNRLLVIEQRRWFGGGVNRLSQRLEAYPHGVDVYRVLPFNGGCRYTSPHDGRRMGGMAEFDRQRYAALDAMLDSLGEPYGIGTIAWFALHAAHLAPRPNDHLPEWARYLRIIDVCSSAYDRAWKIANDDLLPGHPTLSVRPCDLARSQKLHYQFTLVA
jgi:hypothetical protein